MEVVILVYFVSQVMIGGGLFICTLLAWSVGYGKNLAKA